MAKMFLDKPVLDYKGLEEYHNRLLAEVQVLIEQKFKELNKDIVSMSYNAGVLSLQDGHGSSTTSNS